MRTFCLSDSPNGKYTPIFFINATTFFLTSVFFSPFPPLASTSPANESVRSMMTLIRERLTSGSPDEEDEGVWREMLNAEGADSRRVERRRG